MRKFNTLFALLLAAIISFNVSCSKDDDEKTYEKSLLLGTWMQTAGDDFVACPAGDNAKMIITETEIKDYFASENGCSSISYATYDYTFDGKKMTVESGLATYIIEDLNSTTLKIKITSILGGSTSATYTKK
jgi:hypothetical protein